LDQCGHCASCATGEASDVDCDQCEHCSSCQDYATCLDQAKHIPEEKQKCVSSEAIECFIECEECADKMYCLDAFAVEEPSDPDMCAELEAKYPECGAEYEGELDCSPSQEDMDYYSQHCQDDSDDMCAQLEAKYPECGHEYEGELDCSPSQEDVDYYDEHCKNESDDMCAELRAKYPECGAEYEGEVDCSPSQEDMDYYNDHCKRDCHSCVLEFSAAGGCDLWLSGEDPSGVIPAGCEPCAEEAADFCGIPEEDSVDDDSNLCCRAYNADCLSCAQGLSVDEFCRDHLEEFVPGCEHMIVEGEKFVEIKNYPCSTHGQEAPNQMYRMVGMGANGFEIFQGTSNPAWWIYYDSNCGMTEPAHAPAWYLTTEEPDFGALENLAGRVGGCTNTLRIDEIGTFEPRLDMRIDSYFCEGQGWVHRTGNPVIVDMGFKRDDNECIEDGHAFLSYVRSVAVNEANPRIREFITDIEMAGCDVLRHDHDAKFDWCTFHPEARRACSCVCEEVNQPKPVCDPEQMESWLKRDLSSECTELFIAGLAEEHRSSCACMQTISDHDAHEMFSSECYFHDWSDRSFMQLWRDCNQH